MSSQPVSQPSELHSQGVHDADIDGLSITRSAGQAPQQASHVRRWIWGVLLVVLVTVAGAWSTGLLPRAVTVDVVTVVRLPPGGSAGLAATGYVVAQRQASIASKAIGRLEFIGVRVGDRVKEGGWRWPASTRWRPSSPGWNMPIWKRFFNRRWQRWVSHARSSALRSLSLRKRRCISNG